MTGTAGMSGMSGRGGMRSGEEPGPFMTRES